MAEYSVIGKHIPRVDSIPKITGSAKYTTDIYLPGMLCAKILRSTYPHAKILNIDTGKAEALPGVKLVLTGKDTRGIRFAFVDTPRYPADEQLFAEDKVRYIGEAVAMVVATRDDICEEAVELIDIEYELLPGVFDPFEAMKPGAPEVHGEQIPAPGRTCAWEDWGVARKSRAYNPVNNIAATVSIGYGDVQKGFAEADYIFEDRFYTPATSHVAMEPHNIVASYDKLTGKLDIWESRQCYEIKRFWIGKSLGIPLSKIRFHHTYIGSSFGGKGLPFDFDISTSLASVRLGKPVKLVLTRDEVFTSCRNSHRLDMTIKKGVKKDGTIVAQEGKVVCDAGAYRGSAPVVMFLAHSFSDPLYNNQNVSHSATAVYTNKSIGFAKRGHGSPQMRFATESQMDIIADKLGLDPIEFRLKNMRHKGDLLQNGDTLHSYGVRECLQAAANASGWKDKRGKLPAWQGIGCGVSAMFSGSAYWPYAAAAIIRMNLDGTVTLFQGTCEIGNGQETTMCMIAAEQLGLKVEDVTLVSADSELCPVDYVNWLSGGVYVQGGAVLRAAEDLKQQLIKAAADALETEVGNIELKGGRASLKDQPDKSMTYAEVQRFNIQRHHGDSLIGKGYRKAVDEMEFYPSLSKGTGRFTDAYAFSAAVAEAEVDPETGRVKVKKVWAADDCGNDLNPICVEGQIQGQIVMAEGDVIFEEIVAEEGRVLNPSLVDYEIPRAFDIPEMELISSNDYEPNGPYGGKEVGECSRAAIIAAIANAVCNAIGARIYTLPFTPEKVLKAIEEKNKTEK